MADTTSWNFVRVIGAAQEISIGADGSVWALNAASQIFRYDASRKDWQLMPGAAVRIAVDPQGNAWVVDSAKQIWRYDTSAGSFPWRFIPGTAIDIGIGADGTVWAISGTTFDTNGKINRWNGVDWVQVPGEGVRVAVEPRGAAWVIQKGNQFYRRILQNINDGWEIQPRALRQVAINKAGAVFAIGTTPIQNGNFEVLVRDGAADWLQIPRAAAVRVAVEPTGTPWLLTANGEIFRGEPEEWPLHGPISPTQVSGPEKTGLVCSSRETASDNCGKTKADWVGEYKLDLTCDRGTYSPLYGGTCWTCPEPDGLGNPWVINLTKLEEEGGCWRVPYERWGPAKWVKFGWDWDCNKGNGEFWTTYDRNGDFVWGGSSWKCDNPEFPRRTQFWIAGPQACATPVWQGRPANLVRFNGCPTPDKSAMRLTGERLPDRPFLDIAAGWSAGVPSGACFACPVVDEEGYFLVTTRNADTLINGKERNTGCSVLFKYLPPAFDEPGLTGMDGIRTVLFEKNFLGRSDDVTKFLYFLAASRNVPEAARRQFVIDKWREIAASPYRSDAVRTVAYGYIREAAAKAPSARSAAEAQLLASFEKYIQRRRTYLAQQALNMYIAWKADDDANRARRKVSPLEQLFYYGTVPFDFQSVIRGMVSVSAVGSGIVGTISGIQAFSLSVKFQEALAGGGLVATKESSLLSQMGGLNILKTSGGAAALSGATIINVAFAILGSIAIDQFVEIVTAKPKLEAALAEAQKPVNLAEFVRQVNGEDLAAYYWAKAMESMDETDNATLVWTANSSFRAAYAKNFQQ